MPTPISIKFCIQPPSLVKIFGFALPPSNFLTLTPPGNYCTVPEMFARLMMVCKSRPDIDIKEAIALYEFTAVPRSLFVGDETMMHCSCNSTLMHILEKQIAEF